MKGTKKETSLLIAYHFGVLFNDGKKLHIYNMILSSPQ